MLNFVYDNKTTLIFGKGTHHETGTLLKPLGKKILLHYGSGSIRRSGLYDAVTASLKAAGVEYEELGGVQANPTLPLVYEGIRLCRKHGLGLVLAVGGGSVIDSAKAIALGVPHEGGRMGTIPFQKTASVRPSARRNRADHSSRGQREQPEYGHHQ